MWHPFRTEEYLLTTPLSVEACRARLRARLHARPREQRGAVARGASADPLAGEVSTYAFALRKSIPYNNGFQTEARGQFRAVPGGTQVRVTLALPLLTRVSLMVGLLLLLVVALASLTVAAHGLRTTGHADWSGVLIAPFLGVSLLVFGSIYRLLARGDRAFLLRLLHEELAPQEPQETMPASRRERPRLPDDAHPLSMS